MKATETRRQRVLRRTLKITVWLQDLVLPELSSNELELLSRCIMQLQVFRAEVLRRKFASPPVDPTTRRQP